jgi:hypothetical protein
MVLCDALQGKGGVFSVYLISANIRGPCWLSRPTHNMYTKENRTLKPGKSRIIESDAQVAIARFAHIGQDQGKTGP